MFSRMEIAAQTEAQIVRFARGYRRRLRKMVVVSPRFSDLLFSFPAVAFALVSGFGTVENRGRTVALVKRGAPLRDVASALGLPMWLRKLPPEAFVEPFGDVPGGDAFARRVGAVIPRDNPSCGVWLRWLLAGYRDCDSRFAVWLGSQPIFGRIDPYGTVPVSPIATFAWYSRRPVDDPARALIQRPWQPSMGFATAVEEAGAWVTRVAASTRPSARRRGPGRYSRKNAAKGLHFVVLQTRCELMEEGREMDHCVGSYADAVARGSLCLAGAVLWSALRLFSCRVLAIAGCRQVFLDLQMRGLRSTDTLRSLAHARSIAVLMMLHGSGFGPLTPRAKVMLMRAVVG